METKSVHKKDIGNLLDGFVREYEVFAPIRRDGSIIFDRIDDGGEAALDFKNSKMSAKGIFFPQTEVLFNYRCKRDRIDTQVPIIDEKPYLIFGIRPCDAMSLTTIETVFSQKHKDPYFLDRKKSAVVISIGCNTPSSTCFCTSVEGGPFATKGSDLLFIDTGDEYLIQAVTEKGEKLMEGTALSKAHKRELESIKDLKKTAEAAMGPGVETGALKKSLDNLFEDPLWNKLAEKCLGCGICTYLCPACHCFDILDEEAGPDGKRIRIWDSCQFPLFTLQTSGFNPRPKVKERFRQRIMHKFSYLVDEHGVFGCSGCGRCVTACPVNLDIRQALNDILDTGKAR